MTIKKVKVTLKLKDTLMNDILYYIDDIKDHIRRCEDLVDTNDCVDDTDIDDFIKWFDWLEGLCYEYNYKFLPSKYNEKFNKLTNIYVDCKARVAEMAKEIVRERNYMTQMSYRW